MTHRTWLAILAVAALTAGAAAGARPRRAPEAPPPGPEDLAKALDPLLPSLVRVEYTLRYDRGEAPRGAGNVGGNSGLGFLFEAEEAVDEERPLEVEGLLVGPTEVVTPDPMVHPRFLERVAVRFRDDVVRAKVSAYAKDRWGVFLDLERPLRDARPCAFEARRPGPLFSVTYARLGGEWLAGISPVLEGLMSTDAGRRYLDLPVGCVVVDAEGVAVGLPAQVYPPADESWKGSPRDWPRYGADEMARLVAAMEKRVAGGLLSVTLYLRSPAKDVAARAYSSTDEEEDATEMHAGGLLLAGGRVLVLAHLKPKMTARLERIVVRPAAGEPAAARFDASLRDYGALVASLDKPPAGALALSARPILACRDLLLPAVEVRVHGDTRTVHVGYRRLDEFSVGWRGRLVPSLDAENEGTHLFLFDPDGALLAAPIVRRPRVASVERFYSEEAKLVSAADLRPVLDDLAAHADPHNVPRSEAEEKRLAWLGLELQPLDKDLARANHVSAQTRDGETGAMVAYVYPGSPAAKAGVEPGFILLRLRVEGCPKPLDVRLDHDFDGGPFPWDDLDQVPEAFFERIPPPWPAVENRFLRALTDLGFGARFTAECFHDGRVVEQAMEVAPGPPHYDAAPRFKSPALGLTVRDLTYEVRRYFRKDADEPGVIVSKVEPGSKASVSGIKPYEIITHVNDKPVGTVQDFEKATGGDEPLRLSVKRLTRGRVVKIGRPAAEPARPPGADPPAGP